MKTTLGRFMAFLLFISLTTFLPGCAAAWFAGGAATGVAVAEHNEHH